VALVGPNWDQTEPVQGRRNDTQIAGRIDSIANFLTAPLTGTMPLDAEADWVRQHPDERLIIGVAVDGSSIGDKALAVAAGFYREKRGDKARAALAWAACGRAWAPRMHCMLRRRQASPERRAPAPPDRPAARQRRRQDVAAAPPDAAPARIDLPWQGP
jgi:hypothetical protein